MAKVQKLTCKFLLFSICLLSAELLYAVGLGNIRVHSYLNEPLDAEITLKDTKGLTQEQILPQVGDHEEFIQAGLEPPDWLESVQCKLAKNAAGVLVMKVTTPEAIKDPFVDLLIQIVWPNGKLVREYTLLFDPPPNTKRTYNPRLAPLSEISESAKASTTSTITPAPAEIQASHVVLPNGRYGPIHHETLWSIAKKLIANTKYTTHQAVIAIVTKNPQVFNGNIHYLKDGAVLNLPSLEEIRNVSAKDAKLMVDKQMDLPQRSLPAAPTFPVTPTASAPNLTSAPVSMMEDDPLKSPALTEGSPSKPLKLVAPINDLKNNSIPEDIRALPTQGATSERLSLIEEAIDTLKRTNEDISQKNQSLQQQNASLATLLADKEAELNRLKESTQSGAEKAEFAVAIPDLLAADANAPHAKMPSSTMQQDKVATQHQIAPVHPKHIADAPVPAKKDHMFLLFILVLGASIGGWLWFSRVRLAEILSNLKSAYNQRTTGQSLAGKKILSRKEAKEELEFDLDRALTAVASEEKRYLAPKMAPTPPPLKVPEAAKAAVVPNKAPVTPVAPVAVLTPGAATLEDAELDIAYERYELAEKTLLNILAKQPQHKQALLKLLELYVLTENYQQFSLQFAGVPKNLKETDPKLWSQIAVLLAKVDNEKPLLPQVKLKTPSVPQHKIPAAPAPKIASPTPVQKAPSSVAKPVEAPKEFIDLSKDYKLTLESNTAKKEDNNKSQQDPQSQLSLAQALIEVGDLAAARDLLIEVLSTGSSQQKQAAQKLLEGLDKR